MKIKFVTINKSRTNLSVAELSKHDLEELVQESKILRKYDENKVEFYAYDTLAITKAQIDYNFLITELKEFNPDLNITFGGRKTNKDGLTEDKIILLIKDLDHKTSVRFAYAVYQLMIQNRQRFSKVLGKSNYNIIPSNLEAYFNDRLRKYLRHDIPKNL